MRVAHINTSEPCFMYVHCYHGHGYHGAACLTRITLVHINGSHHLLQMYTTYVMHHVYIYIYMLPYQPVQSPNPLIIP